MTESSVETLNRVYDLLCTLSYDTEAAVLLGRSIPVFKCVYGNSHYYVSLAFHNVISLNVHLGNSEAAQAFYAESLFLEHNMFKDSNSGNIALLLIRRGDKENGQKLLPPISVISPDHSDSMPSRYFHTGQAKAAKLFLHLDLLVEKRKHGEFHPSVARYLSKIAAADLELEILEEAEAYYTQALAIFKQFYGEIHTQIAIVLSGLSAVYRGQGKMEKAKDVAEKSFDMLSKLNSSPNLLLADSLYNLAQAHLELGNLEPSEIFFSESYEISEALYGEYSPFVARCFTGMGILNITQNFAAAKFYFEKSINTCKADYHTTNVVFKSLESFALLNGKKGNLELTKTALEMSLQITNTHFSEVTIFNNFAIIYTKVGQLGFAKSYFKKSLSIKLFGAENVKSAINSLYNICYVYEQLQKYQMAHLCSLLALRMLALLPHEDPQLEHALQENIHTYEGKHTNLLEINHALTIKKFGKTHPEVANCLFSNARIRRLMGDLEKAEFFHKEALALRIKLFGDIHPDVAVSLHYIARVYDKQGNLELAQLFYEQALHTFRQLPKPHPCVFKSLLRYYDLSLKLVTDINERRSLLDIVVNDLRSLNNMVSTELLDDTITSLVNLSQSAGELLSYQQKLDLRVRVFGEIHTKVADSLCELGNYFLTLSGDQNVKPSQFFLERSLDVRKQLFGQVPKDSVASLYHLTKLYIRQGNFRKGIPLAKEAIKIDPQSKLAASLKNFLSEWMGLHGKIGDAIKYLGLCVNFFGKIHPEVAKCLFSIARLYEESFNTSEAILYYSQSLNILRHLYGEHPEVTKLLLKLIQLSVSK